MKGVNVRLYDAISFLAKVGNPSNHANRLIHERRPFICGSHHSAEKVKIHGGDKSSNKQD